jgi:cyanophycinase
MRVHLIGGGRDRAAVLASHGPFVDDAMAAGDGPVVAYVLDDGPETDLERWTSALREAGAREVVAVPISPTRGPRAEDLEGAGGVYVAGGWTPGYRDALMAAGMAWLDVVRRRQLPYAGFSAGAALAAERAIVGGWRATVDGRDVAVCPEEAGEDLEGIAVRDGLGLVPFCVDVHAAQWGTLPRLLHALAIADRSEGWAVDEGTALVVGDGLLTVHGLGAAHRIRRTAGGATVTAHAAGATVELSAPVQRRG